MHNNTWTTAQGYNTRQEIALFGRCSFVNNGALTVLSGHGTWDELLRRGFKTTGFNACSSVRIPPGRDTPSALNSQRVSQPCRPCRPCRLESQANGRTGQADDLGKLHCRTLILDIPCRRVQYMCRTDRLRNTQWVATITSKAAWSYLANLAGGSRHFQQTRAKWLVGMTVAGSASRCV